MLGVSRMFCCVSPRVSRVSRVSRVTEFRLSLGRFWAGGGFGQGGQSRGREGQVRSLEVRKSANLVKGARSDKVIANCTNCSKAALKEDSQTANRRCGQRFPQWWAPAIPLVRTERVSQSECLDITQYLPRSTIILISVGIRISSNCLLNLHLLTVTTTGGGGGDFYISFDCVYYHSEHFNP